ncbi:hypothetical protein SAMN02745216_01207 [Desulfatibacillum alkenivorans DSM 16219]|uniref:Uncharacterized protein n=1 Tax=Desulfatibacillum alkenivorans DSM 16219 TaxID=1121393 RepID=A0A1M6HEZ6_9BACT|nr:hypothetical protein [Desulfatibacillum alkenivorans]SHJ20723.1 hypothetical protein SAMN02745216_01207 [Desulfatibacillum alkenivorans DSM 16219]
MAGKHPECPLYNPVNCREYYNPKVCAVVRTDKVCLKKRKAKAAKASSGDKGGSGAPVLAAAGESKAS